MSELIPSTMKKQTKHLLSEQTESLVVALSLG